MKTAIIYYSYTGNTKRIAQAHAADTGADLIEVQTQKRPGTVAAYVMGSFRAMGQKSVAIQPLGADLATYDKLVLMAPIWAGYPAPALNAVISQLPTGKDVELRMVSISGASAGKDKVVALVESTGCRVVDYLDVSSRSK